MTLGTVLVTIGKNTFQILKNPSVEKGIGVAIGAAGIGIGAILFGKGVQEATTGVKKLGEVETPIGTFNVIGIVAAVAVVGVVAYFIMKWRSD